MNMVRWPYSWALYSPSAGPCLVPCACAASSQLDSGCSSVTCFDKWDASKCDWHRNLQRTCTTGLIWFCSFAIAKWMCLGLSARGWERHRPEPLVLASTGQLRASQPQTYDQAQPRLKEPFNLPADSWIKSMLIHWSNLGMFVTQHCCGHRWLIGHE